MRILGHVLGSLGLVVFMSGFAMTMWPLFGGPIEAVIVGALGLPATFLLVSASEKLSA